MTDTLSLAKDLVKVERQIAKVEAILEQLGVKRATLLTALRGPVKSDKPEKALEGSGTHVGFSAYSS